MCCFSVRLPSTFGSNRGSCACVSVKLKLKLHLGHHGFLVLLLLRDFDRRLLGNGRNQEVHQDVFAISHAVHRGQQVGRYVVREQVVVVSDTHKGEKTDEVNCVFISFFFLKAALLFSSLLYGCCVALSAAWEH